MSNRLLVASEDRLGRITTMAEAERVAHTLSEPSKMPGYCYSIPATACTIGSKLRAIKGSTCSKCYALKGRYVFKKVVDAMRKRLDALQHPLWTEAMAFMINHHASRKPEYRYFRWHDSGDLQGLWHLMKIVEVCKMTPDVIHWLPTRELNIVRQYLSAFREFPSNLIVRISAPMMGHAIQGIPGLPVSTVDLPGFGVQCEAYKRGGQCGECRACWTSANINYPKH